MSAIMQPLDELIQELSPSLRGEVRTFVEFLLSKHIRPVRRKLRQDWAGMLNDDEHTSVELQHLASDWRNG